MSDIFDGNSFYKEYPIDDLQPSFNAFNEIKWVGENKLSVTYWVGDRNEKASPKTVVFDLNELGAKKSSRSNKGMIK